MADPTTVSTGRATRTVVVQLKKSVVWRHGKADNKGRWYLTDERVGSGSRCNVCGIWLRSPSAAYPHSVLKHCYSRKHALACLEAGVATLEDCETEEKEVGPREWTVYKIVRVKDGRMVSAYDDTTEYRLGETLTQTARSGHQGGFYGYEGTPEGQDVTLTLQGVDGLTFTSSLRRRFQRAGLLLPADRCLPGTYALIECRGEGRKLRYSGAPGCASGKLAFSRLTPTRVLATFEVERFLTQQQCPECQGSGNAPACPTCGGYGHGTLGNDADGYTPCPDCHHTYLPCDCEKCAGYGKIWA